MADTYVIVHGAWHTGAEMEAAAALVREAGHTVHCPTLAGNRAGDNKTTTGLKDAVDSLVDYIVSKNLSQVRLVGHSYGGMVISMTYDRIPDRIQRLVYVNAFVPLPGESLNDLVPPHYLGLFDAIAAGNANAVMLPFPIWRESFINDADLALAQSSYGVLNAHPYKTFTDKAELQQPLAAAQVGKSYINCQQDTAMPHGSPWHPRMSEKLGLFRLVECQGSHEIWFTDPATIADAIVKAGRD